MMEGKTGKRHASLDRRLVRGLKDIFSSSGRDKCGSAAHFRLRVLLTRNGPINFRSFCPGLQSIGSDDERIRNCVDRAFMSVGGRVRMSGVGKRGTGRVTGGKKCRDGSHTASQEKERQRVVCLLVSDKLINGHCSSSWSLRWHSQCEIVLRHLALARP